MNFSVYLRSRDRVNPAKDEDELVGTASDVNRALAIVAACEKHIATTEREEKARGAPGPERDVICVGQYTRKERGVVGLTNDPAGGKLQFGSTAYPADIVADAWRSRKMAESKARVKELAAQANALDRELRSEQDAVKRDKLATKLKAGDAAIAEASEVPSMPPNFRLHAWYGMINAAERVGQRHDPKKVAALLPEVEAELQIYAEAVEEPAEDSG